VNRGTGVSPVKITVRMTVLQVRSVEHHWKNVSELSQSYLEFDPTQLDVKLTPLLELEVTRLMRVWFDPTQLGMRLIPLVERSVVVCARVRETRPLSQSASEFDHLIYLEQLPQRCAACFLIES
jgi:hypothetical protein